MPPVLVKPVDLVEERGHLLHLVDDHLAHGGALGQLASEPLGILEVPAKLVGLQEIDPDGVRVRRLQEGALAGLAGPPEEEGLGSRGG